MYTIWCHTHAASCFPQKRTQTDTCARMDSNLEVIYFSHEDLTCLLSISIRPIPPWKLGEWPCHGFPNYKHIGGCHFPLQRKRRRRRRRAPSWRRYLHTSPPHITTEEEIFGSGPPARPPKRKRADGWAPPIPLLSFWCSPFLGPVDKLEWTAPSPKKGGGRSDDVVVFRRGWVVVGMGTSFYFSVYILI